LKDLGLADLGYNYVTVDCGWTLPNRTANGTLTWNPARFPSGGGATLGNFVHGLGLKFGVYSDAGTQMCMTGDPVQAGSLCKLDVIWKWERVSCTFVTYIGSCLIRCLLC
jgi:alpha-galactosidase